MSNLGLQPRGRKEPDVTERSTAAHEQVRKNALGGKLGYVHFFHIWVMLWLRLKSGIKRLCAMRCKES